MQSQMKYRWLLRFLLVYRKRVFLIVALNWLVVGFALVNPFLAKVSIDSAYRNKDVRLFITLVAWGGVIFFTNLLFNSLADYLHRVLSAKVSFDLHRYFFKKIHTIPYLSILENTSGEKLFNVQYDVEQVSVFVVDFSLRSIMLLLRALMLISAIFYLDRSMGLVILLCAPATFLVSRYFTTKLRVAFQGLVEDSSGIFNKIQEVLMQLRLVKAFGKESRHVHYYTRRLITNVRISLKNARLEAAAFLATVMCNRFILGGIVLFGGLQVLHGRMSLGCLAAIAIYLGQLAGLQDSLTNLLQQLSLGLISCARIDKLMDRMPSGLVSSSVRDVQLDKASIDIRNLSFCYRKGAFVLSHLNCSIKGGSCVGFVGASGCGKTTLLSLIIRLYHPESGTILVDGFDIYSISQKSYYAQVSAALQETMLWNSSVQENISYGKADASFEEIERASRIAQAHDFIMELPNGYATIIGERGCTISEGQKQRIALARAIVGKPKILILDEALSMLDGETEQKIMHTLKRELASSTILIVSHRLAIIQETDSVFFLRGPSRIEHGAHNELVLQDQEYRDFFVSQLQSIEKSERGSKQRIC